MPIRAIIRWMGPGAGNSRPPRWASWFLALALALVSVACSRDGGQEVTHWRLEVPGREARDVELPKHLDRELPEVRVDYRLTSEVTLQPELRGQEIELLLLYLPAQVQVRVNGLQARAVGEMSWRAEHGSNLPRRFLLPAAATQSTGPLRIELEVQHAWTHSAWWEAAPVLMQVGSPTPRADRNRLFNEQGGWFGLIALCQVGLTFLVVYFWDRRRRAYLWFAIQALTASYYPAYILGLPSLGLSWPVQNVLLAASLAVAPIISVYFSHAFFGLSRPHHAWLLLLTVAIVSPLTVAARDYHFHDLSYATPIVVLCVLSGVIYQLGLGIKLLYSSAADRGTVIFFLCCWIALGTSSWVDLLAWLGVDVLSGARPACTGLGLFAIFQSLLLGRSHFRSLAEADQLNEKLRSQVQDLQARQNEVANLNEELRRQIGRRTQDILTAITNSGANAPADLAQGHVIEGRYRIVEILGRGGMGTVYRVERTSDGRQLAAKVSQEIRGLALARLAREAQIAAAVHHPNVVSIVDADVAQDGYAFLVMELVEGRSLAECEAGHSLRWCLEVLRQTLEGVRALHAHGIVHRDLKPNNILLSNYASEQPCVKITDFGISRWLSDEPAVAADADAREPDEASTGDEEVVERTISLRSHPPTGTRAQGEENSARHGSGALHKQHSSPQLTRTGAITGTPRYVAPELSDRRAQLTPAVDVFSIGVVAYQMLAGRLPHVEPPLLARLAGRKIPSVPPVASLRSDLGRELAHGFDACLNVDPMQRPTVQRLIALVEGELSREEPGDTSSAPPTRGIA